MIHYFLILLSALLIFPLLFFLAFRGKVRKSTLWFALFGLCIAIIGIFLQQNISLYYAILAMAGLVFALSVLLDKRLEGGRSRDEALSEEPQEPVVVLPTEPILAEEEAAAATVGESDDEFTLTPLEDDLDRWMASEQKDISGELERKESRDEQ